MKAIVRYFYPKGICQIALAFFAASPCGADNELRQAERLRAAAQDGPAPLLQYVRECQVAAPRIYSQWYVDRLASQDAQRGTIEQARREFGRSVLQSLEKLAPTLRAPAKPQARQESAIMLLDLADWCSTPPGYGNAFLFSRLHDLATVPLAYLIADLSYDETNLVAMVSRLVCFPDEVKRNVRVLNLEAQDSVFRISPKAKSSVGVWRVDERAKIADSIVNPIEYKWYKQLAKVHQWQVTQNKYHGLPVGKGLREALPDSLAFFVDDDFVTSKSGPFTTLNQWDGKHHRRLYAGLGGYRNIMDVRSFLLFRQKVGSFPTNPPTWWQPGDGVFQTPIKAAFSDAWQPFRNVYDLHDASASTIFDALQSDSFYDEDTRKTILFVEMQAANEALRKQAKDNDKAK